MKQADDLITIKAAASRAERAPITIKRWIQAGRLKAYRKGKSRTAPIHVSANALSMILVDQAPRQAVTGGMDQGMNQAAGELVDVLKDEVADLRRQRDSLQAELTTTRRELVDARERIAALEREMNMGARGLLRSGVDAIRRRFGYPGGA